MTMPATAKVSMVVRLSAPISGTVNALPNKLKPMLKGEMSAWTMFSPAVSCHHGVNRETTTKTIVNTPPAKPNQLSFSVMFCHLR